MTKKDRIIKLYKNKEYLERIAEKTGCRLGYVTAVLKDAGYLKRKVQKSKQLPVDMGLEIKIGERITLIYPNLPGGTSQEEKKPRIVHGVVQQIYKHHVLLICDTKNPCVKIRECFQLYEIWKYRKE